MGIRVAAREKRTRRALRVLLFVALLVHPTALVAQVASSVVIAGVVRDAGTGSPIVGATVSLAGTTLAAITGENGRFTLARVDLGTYGLVAEHVAYAAMTDTIRLSDAGALYNLEIRMSVDPIALAPITVSVMRAGPLTDVYDRMDRMRSLGLGNVFDRQDIEASGVSRVTHLVHTIPGARLQSVAGRVGAMDLRLNPRNDCPPSYYIDGIRTPMEGESLDDYTPLSVVEAVEVYRRLSTLPGEFADEHAQLCGAVAVWTRRGPVAGTPFGWRRMIALVGFFAFAAGMSSVLP